MPSRNRVEVIGYLGGDPEMRFTTTGKPVANFSVAATEKWKDQSGAPQERTEWFRVTVFDKRAEFCNKALQKGSLVSVVGSHRSDKYTDREGVERNTWYVLANEVLLLAKGRDYDDNPAPARPSDPSPHADSSFSDEDIPF